MNIYITTFFDPDNKNGTFIRANQTHSGAYEEALVDLNKDLAEMKFFNGDREIDCVEREDDSPSVLRILNPNNGYEYQAYIITEELLNE